MATNKSTTFSSMLNEYLSYDLLEDEFKNADNWLLKNANWDKSWQGGYIPVPIQVGIANSVKMGGLTADNDIAAAQYVRGNITSMKEAYGALSFYSRDLFENGKVSEQNFLRLLPDQLTQLMDHFKQTISLQVFQGNYLDSAATGTVIATDVLFVNRTERFYLNQKIIINDGIVPAVESYVKSVNKNTGQLFLVTARGGSTPADLAGMTIASIKLYTDGASSEFFTSLKSMLLPASLGGSDTFATLTKVNYPYTQSVLYDATASTTSNWGSVTAVTRNTILNLFFDAQRQGRRKGAKPKVAICGWKHYHAALLQLESASGAYKNIKPSVNYADYSEMEVGGIMGSIKIVGIREMDDDWIVLLDPAFLDLKTGKSPFQIMESPEGLKWYTIRATTGYQYVTDIRLAGDFIYRAPHTATVIHSIPNYAFNP